MALFQLKLNVYFNYSLRMLDVHLYLETISCHSKIRVSSHPPFHIIRLHISIR